MCGGKADWMMSDASEERENGGFGYSTLLDILLEWGAIRLFQTGHEQLEALSELEEQWNAASAELGPSRVSESLSHGLTQLEDRKKETIEYLRSRDTLDIEIEDAWYVESALGVLDHITALSDALFSFPASDAFPEIFLDQARLLLDLDNPDLFPSWLRFTPLNSWRRRISSRIPEKCLYFFPWYTSWNELPEDILDEIVEHWNELSSGELEVLELEPEVTLTLLEELTADGDLLRRIRREAQLTELLPTAVQVSYALRLLQLADKEALKRDLPESIAAAGLATCAADVIAQPFHSETERLEKLFLAAFCGPFLNDRQRLNLLAVVEKELQAPSQLALPLLNPQSILGLLYRWSCHEIAGPVLASEIFDGWISALCNAAKKARSEAFVADDPSVFFETVDRLQVAPATEAGVAKVWDEEIAEGSQGTAAKLTAIMAYLYLREYYVRQAHRRAASLSGRRALGLSGGIPSPEQEKTEPPETLSCEVPAYIECEVDLVEGEIEIPYLPDNDQAAGKLEDALRDFHECWTAGLAWQKSGQLRVIEPICRHGGRRRWEKDLDYTHLLICLGTNREEVQRALQVLKDWADASPSAEQALELPRGVVLLFYKLVQTK